MKNQSLLSVLVLCFLGLGDFDAGDEFFDSDGVKIRYVTEGKGEAVVLIHGWMADSSMWGRDASGNTKLNTDNAGGFLLIALDCRGHGKSDKPHDSVAYGAEMADDVVRLLDHLKIEKAHLVGYSSGAFIAGKVAATYPQRVLSVVYAGQAPVIKESMKPTDFAECEIFARAVDEGKDLGSYIMAVTPPSRPKPTAEQAKAIAAFMFAGKDVEALATAGRSFPDLAATADELKKCAAPILFIHGENESDHVKGKVAAAHELLGRGDVRIVEGGDHMTTLTKPEFGSAILEFLRSTSQNRPATEPGAEPDRAACSTSATLALGATPVTIHRYVADTDAAFERAVAAGATAVMPVMDMFWGDRYGLLKDPFGHQGDDEMRKAGKEAMAGMGGGELFCAESSSTSLPRCRSCCAWRR